MCEAGYNEKSARRSQPTGRRRQGRWLPYVTVYMSYYHTYIQITTH